MNPKDILDKFCHFAVIGVSPNKEKFGYQIFKRLKDLEYDVSGVSPLYDHIDEDKLYPSLESIPHPIDVVVFVIKKDYAYDYVDEMVGLGIRYAWMQPHTYDDELLKYMCNVGITPIKACILVETQSY